MSPAEGDKKSFAELFSAQPVKEATPKRRGYHVGDKVEVEIAAITGTSVLVDLDGKRHAYFERVDLATPTGELTVKVGDRVQALVVGVDGSSGEVRLGRSAGRAESTAALEAARESGVPIDGKVTGVNKGGLEVDLGGARGFCPMSQIDLRRVEDATSYVGRTLRFRVTEIKDGGKSIVLSRRKVLEEERAESQARTLESLEIGKTVRGVVSQLREFGAFVELDGVQALIPLSELTHDRSQRPADVVKIGDVVEAQVRKVERDEEGRPRVSLSLKALAADPWDAIDVIAPEGKVVAGVVTRTQDFGVFVKLASGIEGLLHVSEIGGNKRPQDAFKPGQSLVVSVQRVDRAARKLSLVPAPEGAEIGGAAPVTSLAVGAIVSGTVDRVEPFGVFVQIDGTKGKAGRGLVPNGELGTPRGADVRKLFPLGHKIEAAKVVEATPGRMRLSIKAVGEDEERAQYDGYREQVKSEAGFGTFADLLKKKK